MSIIPCEKTGPPAAGNAGHARDRTELLGLARKASEDVRRTAPALTQAQCRELDQLVSRFLRGQLTDADRATIASEPAVADLLIIVAAASGGL